MFNCKKKKVFFTSNIFLWKCDLIKQFFLYFIFWEREIYFSSAFGDKTKWMISIIIFPDAETRDPLLKHGHMDQHQPLWLTTPGKAQVYMRHEIGGRFDVTFSWPLFAAVTPGRIGFQTKPQKKKEKKVRSSWNNNLSFCWLHNKAHAKRRRHTSRISESCARTCLLCFIFFFLGLKMCFALVADQFPHSTEKQPSRESYLLELHKTDGWAGPWSETQVSGATSPAVDTGGGTEACVVPSSVTRGRAHLGDPATLFTDAVSQSRRALVASVRLLAPRMKVGIITSVLGQGFPSKTNLADTKKKNNTTIPWI